MSGAPAWVGVAVLGGIGALLRMQITAWVARGRATHLPLGTLAVNLTGAFVLGVLVGAGVDGDALLVAGAGLLGGYTTFSTWMVEAQGLRRRERPGLAALLLLGSLGLGLAVTAAGWALAEAVG